MAKPKANSGSKDALSLSTRAGVSQRTLRRWRRSSHFSRRLRSAGVPRTTSWRAALRRAMSADIGVVDDDDNAAEDDNAADDGNAAEDDDDAVAASGASAGGMESSPTNPLDDLVGLKKAKSDLLEALANKKNALLFGPPGCGKTPLVRLAAQHLGYRCIEKDASDFRIDAIDSIFNELNAPGLILFVDEGDKLIVDRDDLEGDDYAVLLKMLKKMEEKKGLIVMATNLTKARLDRASKRRFFELIEVGKPLLRDRIALLKKGLKWTTGDDDIKEAAMNMKGCSSSDVLDVVEKARIRGVQDGDGRGLRKVIKWVNDRNRE